MSRSRSSVLLLTLLSALAPTVGAAQAPAAYAAGSTTEAPPVRVRVSAPEASELTLHRIAGEHFATATVSGYTATAHGFSFETICEAPCVGTVASGRHRLAVSRGMGPPVPVDGTFRLDEGADLRIGYDDRSDLRLAGLITVLGGLAVGAGTVLTGLFAFQGQAAGCFGVFCGPDADVGLGVTIAGAVIGGVSLVTGFTLLFQSDGSSVELAPLGGRRAGDAP